MLGLGLKPNGKPLHQSAAKFALKVTYGGLKYPIRQHRHQATAVIAAAHPPPSGHRNELDYLPQIYQNIVFHVQGIHWPCGWLAPPFIFPRATPDTTLSITQLGDVAARHVFSLLKRTTCELISVSSVLVLPVVSSWRDPNRSRE